MVITRHSNEELEYKSFHKKDCLDYINLKDNLYYKMEFRVLRFPISEDSYECIITNLPFAEFNVEEI